MFPTCNVPPMILAISSDGLTTDRTSNGLGLALRMTGLSVKEFQPARNQLAATAASPTGAMIIRSPDADSVHRGYDSIAIGTNFHNMVPPLKDKEKKGIFNLGPTSRNARHKAASSSPVGKLADTVALMWGDKDSGVMVHPVSILDRYPITNRTYRTPVKQNYPDLIPS